jgi:transcriptional regulator with XRE-family HTH domain
MTDHTDGERDRRAREAAIYRGIGAQLRAVRLACGVSQEELAERLGIERVTLSRYESGARTLPLATLVMVAELLRRPIAAFLPNSAVLSPSSSPSLSTAASTQQPTLAGIAEIQAVLTDHPELIASTQSFLDTMLAPEEEG